MPNKNFFPLNFFSHLFQPLVWPSPIFFLKSSHLQRDPKPSTFFFFNEILYSPLISYPYLSFFLIFFFFFFNFFHSPTRSFWFLILLSYHFLFLFQLLSRTRSTRLLSLLLSLLSTEKKTVPSFTAFDFSALNSYSAIQSIPTFFSFYYSHRLIEGYFF
jgi:hypothetical protein